MSGSSLSLFAGLNVRLPDKISPSCYTDAHKLVTGIQNKLALFEIILTRRLPTEFKSLSALHDSVTNNNGAPAVADAIPIIDAFDANFDAYMYTHSVIAATLTVITIGIKTAVEVVESDAITPTESAELSSILGDVVKRIPKVVESFTRSYNSLMTLAAVSCTIRHYVMIQSARVLLSPFTSLDINHQTLISAYPSIEIECPDINIDALPVFSVEGIKDVGIFGLIDLDIQMVNISEMTNASLRVICNFYGQSVPAYTKLERYSDKLYRNKMAVSGQTDRALLQYHAATLNETLMAPPSRFQNNAIVSALTRKFGGSIFADVLAIVVTPLNIT